MGTSKSYSGPSGKNPLIPPWAEVDVEGNLQESPIESDPSIPNTDQNNNPSIPNIPNLESWGNVKGNFTRYASRSSSSGYGGRRTMRSFVRAQGGARMASNSSRRGRSVIQNI